jgi:CAAX prenyl protease-like protein
MNSLITALRSSPLTARVVPFVIFLVITFAQDWFGSTGRYWLYFVKTLVGAWMLWAVWPVVTEMRWKLSWQAIAVGIGVFVMWVGLDNLLVKIGLPNSYPKLTVSSSTWNPNDTFGAGSAMAWFFIVVRICGASLVVPMLEEVFFRSFLYRYVIKADFLSVSLGSFVLRSFVITSLLFGFEHREWLAGVLCGFAYQGLACRMNRLGDAITAHAITNFLLGLWVVSRGAWEFW